MFKNERNFKFFEVSDKADQENLPIDSWKIRPCEWYKEEFKDCKSIRARFHQYFIYGETVDCSQWKSDFNNCIEFRRKNDEKCLEKVITSENERIKKRNEACVENDVWEYRSEPPKNWNSTMPDWMIEDKKHSLLIDTQKMLNEGIEPQSVFNGIRCIIM